MAKWACMAGAGGAGVYPGLQTVRVAGRSLAEVGWHALDCERASRDQRIPQAEDPAEDAITLKLPSANVLTAVNGRRGPKGGGHVAQGVCWLWLTSFTRQVSMWLGFRSRAAG